MSIKEHDVTVGYCVITLNIVIIMLIYFLKRQKYFVSSLLSFLLLIH